MHRDLKPQNILITESCTVKICDFGMARNFKNKIERNERVRSLSPVCCTRWYRSPEIGLGQKKYNESSDIWSLGCIASEMVKQSLPDHYQKDLKALFQGNSSYKISPHVDDKGEDPGSINQSDQMIKILQVLGSSQKLNDEFFEKKEQINFTNSPKTTRQQRGQPQLKKPIQASVRNYSNSSQNACN